MSNIRDFYLAVVKIRNSQSELLEYNKKMITLTNILLNDSYKKNLKDAIKIETKIVSNLFKIHNERINLINILDACIDNYNDNKYFTLVVNWLKVIRVHNKLYKLDKKASKLMDKNRCLFERS